MTFTNSLKFPWESPGLGGSIGGGGGGGGGGGFPWDHRTFPFLSLIVHISFNKNYSRSPAGGNLKLGKYI